MFDAFCYLSTVIVVTLIILYTMAARLPSSMRMLAAYQLAAYETNSAFTVPASKLKLPESWSVPESCHLGSTDDSVYMSRKAPVDTWLCVDVQKVAEQL